ncbi:MAG TPA: FHA domain-containing protein [Myxococcales bacterium]|nr:FHA domain-containing protein [Myxococcales bacterium]
MPFVIVVAEANGRGRAFRFDGREVTIGRGPENDLVVHDPRASRGHARIRARGDGYALLDDGSCNGTHLNDHPVGGAARLRTGDRIRVGGTTLEFAQHRNWLGPARRIFAPLVAVLRGWPSSLRVGGVAVTALVLCAVLGAAAFSHRGAGAAATAAIARDDGSSSGPAAPDVPPAAEMFPDPLSQLNEIRLPYERGRRKLDERRIAPRNLYDAWRAFVSAATGVESAAGGAPIPSALARLIEWTRQELEADCKRLLFGAARSEKYGQDAQAQAAYREMLLRFPADDATGCRRRAKEALAGAETAVPAGSVFGYPEAR